MMRHLRLWHLMFVGGILGGLIGGVHEALAYVNHPAAFVLGLFVGGFVGWGVVSAVVLVYRFIFVHPSRSDTESHPAAR